MRIPTAALAIAWLAGPAAASADRVEALVKTCLEKHHAGHELQNIMIETTELPAAQGGAGAEWLAGIRVEYQQRRSADREWDTWVAPMSAVRIAGKLAVANDPPPFNPARQCATE
jgi:hypothetical protein